MWLFQQNMQISIIIQLNAAFIFLFLLFPSGTNSMNFLPECVTLFINQRIFNYNPLEEGIADKILNVYYRRYLFSKDLQESENSKLIISFISNVYLLFTIDHKIIGRKRLLFSNYKIDDHDFYLSYYKDYELGLCKMMEYRQKMMHDFGKRIKAKKSSKKVEEQKVDCSEGKIGVKIQLNKWKEWIREANFTMFLHYYYKPENWEFYKMLRNFMDQTNNLDIDEVKKRFIKLFGLARMVQLALNYPLIFQKMMNPDGKGQKEFEAEMVENLMKEYMEIKRPNNVIKKWTIRYTLNYFLYKDWWQKYKEEKFKDKKPNPAKLWEKVFEEYWMGENVLNLEMKINGLAKMEEEGNKEGKVKKEEAMFEDMKNNFLGTESFAEDQLAKSSYLEGAKEMTEQFWQFISTGFRENRCSKLKLENGMNEGEMEKFWLECVNVNLKYVAKNLKGQKEMCSEGMMNLMMMERVKESEFMEKILKDHFNNDYQMYNRNFKDLFNYQRDAFLEEYSKKKNNLKGKEISPSIIHSTIHPVENKKEIEIGKMKTKKNEIIEEMDKKEQKISIIGGTTEKTEKTMRKKGKKPKSSMSKKYDQIISDEKAKLEEIAKKKEKRRKEEENKRKNEEEEERNKKEQEERSKEEENKRKNEEEEERNKKEQEERSKEEEEKKTKLTEKKVENKIISQNEIEMELKKKYEVMMKKKVGGKKEEKKSEEKIGEKEESSGEMEEQNYLEKTLNLKFLFSIAKNEVFIFGKQIELFYAIFIAEENDEKLVKLIEFLNICILVKIIEQNFKTFSIISHMKIPLKNKRGWKKRWRQNLAEWEKFKEEHLKNGEEKMVGKLMEEIFKKWKKYSKRGKENTKEEEMKEILSRMHFNELALMIGREAKMNKFGIKMSDGEFEKNSRKYGEKMGEQFYRRLGRIMPTMMNGGGNGWEEFGQKFLDQIKLKMGMVNHLKFEENLKQKFTELIKINEINRYKMEPAKWMDPHFYEISSAENWPKINLESEEFLREYLEEIYGFDLKAEGMKENAKEWLKHQMEEWMRVKMANIYGGEVDYSMVIGGSTLIGTALEKSDLDILFLVPKLNQNPFEDILESLYRHLKEAIQNEGLTQRDAWLQWIEPNNRVPALIKLRIDFVDLDIMMVQIPMEKIPADWNGFSLKKLQLENAESEENIYLNIFFMDFLIEHMLNENEVGGGGGIHQKGGIYSLASYRSTYRQKFVLIEKSTREIFIQLLRAVKYWAKRQHIYSNQFGYLSGTSLTLMATKICILYPIGDLPFLLEKFFFIYATWPWPKPLLLEELTPKEMVEKYKVKMEFWEPKRIEKDEEMMPIITAMFPEGNSAFNVNEMGRKVIKSKMEKAYQMIVENVENGGSNNFWKEQFFRVFDYGNHFEDYLLIICSAKELKNSTCEWIKNKIRQILSIWVEKSKFEGIIEVELKKVLEEYQIMSDFERRGECVKENGRECVGWLVGLNFKSNLKENQKPKFWEDLGEIFTKDYNYSRKTHKLEIFHSKRAKLSISSFILEKNADEMDEKKIKELKLKGKQKIEQQENRPLNPNAEPYYPQSIIQQWMNAFYSTHSYYYPQQFYYYLF